MADVKWIKIVTNIFDNRKIKQIEVMPEGDSIIVVWFKLICLAGNINDNGMVYFTPEVPYTDEMLATEFRRPINIIRLALATFVKFGMVEIIDDFLHLSSWEKYQSSEKLEAIRAKNAERQARFRERKREALANSNADGVLPVTLPVTPRNAVDIEGEGDIEIEGDIENMSLGGDETPPPPPPPPAPPSSPSQSEPPAVIYIPLNDGSEYPVTQQDVDKWKELYQAVDIIQELKKMRGWADANPKKRKTKNGIKRFINSWLASEQDKYHGSEGGGTGGRSNTHAPSQRRGTYV